MKKKLYIIILLFFVLSFSFSTSFSYVYSYALNSNKVVITTSYEKKTNNQIVVTANLNENPGLNACVLKIEYDKNVFSSPTINFKSALSSLNPVFSGDEEQNDCKILYEGNVTDYLTGDMFSLTFNLLPNAKDGKYSIKIVPVDKSIYSYNQNRVYSYYSVKDGNLSIKGLEINIDGSQLGEVKVFDYVEEPLNDNTAIKTILIIVGVVVCFGLIAIIILKIISKSKSKDWEKFDN